MRCALIALLCLAACSKSSGAPNAAPPATAVRVVNVERVKRTRPVHVTGVLANKSEMRASFKIGGILSKVYVDEGDSFQKGQLLAELATAEIDATVQQIRQGRSKATRDLRRAEKLLEGEAATRQQVDDARTAAAVASAQLSAAQFNRAHSVIKALSDGRVLRRLAESGEVVAAGQPIYFLSSEKAGWVVRVGLADRDVVRVAAGDRATVQLAAYPGVPFDAEVDEVASAATPPLGTFEVELRIEVPANGPKPLSGMIASARIDPGARDGAAEVALVPAAALRDGNGKTATVWVPDGKGGVSRRTVAVAFFDGELVAIAAGLDGVSTVVTEGAAYLSPGSKITVVEGSTGAVAGTGSAAPAPTPAPAPVPVPKDGKDNKAKDKDKGAGSGSE